MVRSSPPHPRRSNKPQKNGFDHLHSQLRSRTRPDEQGTREDVWRHLTAAHHYLAVAIRYLLTNRSQWPASGVVGKTLVSSCLIDHVVAKLGRKLWEVPLGFKWFTPRLFDGSCCFGGEESAGASFLRRDGTVWSTDKDGLILGLLAAEITARTGEDPGVHCEELTAEFGTPYYTRIDARAEEPAQETLSGSRHRHRTPRRTDHGKTHARPGNDASIGG